VGLPVELTAMEFDLLEMLMRSAGKVVRETRSRQRCSNERQHRTIAFSMSI